MPRRTDDIATKQSGVPVWVWLAGGGALLVVLLCAGGGVLAVVVGMKAATAMTNPAMSGQPREVRFGEEMRYGDLGVTVESAKIEAVRVVSPGGRLEIGTPEMVIRLRLVCHNPNREIDVRGQVKTSSLEDDVGNKYDVMSYATELGFSGTIENQIQPGHVKPVRSDVPKHDVLVFRRPVPGASTVSLTLDAAQYGGVGKVRVRIPRTAWESK